MARENLVAYWTFQNMSGVLLSHLGLRTLVDLYELVVAVRRRILDPDTIAAGRAYAVPESGGNGAVVEASNLQVTVGFHCMLSKHARLVVAAGLRKRA